MLAAVLFLFYGPFSAFRVLWIQTAMHSTRFRFLAQLPYSERYISQVLREHAVSTDEKTDLDAVTPSGGDGLQYAPVQGDLYRGHLLRIDDPVRLDLVQAGIEEGKLLEDILPPGALHGVNASGYLQEERRGLVWGYCYADGVCVNRCDKGEKHTVGGMTMQNKFFVGSLTDEELRTRQFRWLVEFGPILIVNGEKVPISQSAGGLCPRTAIGQTKDGAMLLLVVDGRQAKSVGAGYLDLQTILYANGAVNAIVLDGGSSSSMVYDKALVNSPSEKDIWRRLPNALVVR